MNKIYKHFRKKDERRIFQMKMKILLKIRFSVPEKRIETAISNPRIETLKVGLYRDMFPYMFNVLLTHNNNFVIVNLAWGQF